MKWFVDSDGDIRSSRMDLREGGEYRLEGTDRGKPWAIWGRYLEVRPPEKLVYTWQWDNDPTLGEPQGNSVVTVEFRDRGTETELVVTHERFETARARDDHGEGWKGCLDRLVRLVEKGGMS